jgi:hypothetical protein
MAGLLDLLAGALGGGQSAQAAAGNQQVPALLAGQQEQSQARAAQAIPPVSGGPLPAAGQAAPTPPPATGAAGSSTVAPGTDPNAIVVTAKRQTPTTNAGAYDNSADLQAAQSGIAKDQAVSQQGGSDGGDIGIPAALGMHSGTLRNLLGTLGDAFLIQSGHQPIHSQAAQRQELADASVGFQNNPGVAASRMMATGVPGSMDAGQKMYDTSQTMQLRQAEQANLNNYRTQQTQNRQDVLHDRQVQQSLPVVSGILQAGARAEQSGQAGAYAKAYQQAKTYAGARNLDIDQDFAAPEQYGDYQAGYGMTSQQQAQAGARSGNLAERTQHDRAIEGIGQENANSNAGRAGAQNFSAHKPTSSTMEQEAFNAYDQAGGDLTKLTPSQRLVINKYQNGTSGSKARSIPAGLAVNPGGKPVPSAADRAYVQKNPQARTAFIAHFGVNP